MYLNAFTRGTHPVNGLNPFSAWLILEITSFFTVNEVTLLLYKHTAVFFFPKYRHVAMAVEDKSIEACHTERFRLASDHCMSARLLIIVAVSID